jgi:LPXTG-site transpeptidase (sortase) family protein
MPTLWVRDDGKGAREKRAVSPGWAYVISVMTGVAVLALGFVLLVGVGSQLQADRDQKVLYDDFRQELAEGTAPVGPLDYEGAVLPPGAPVAVLAIPALDEELVVVEGTTSIDTMSGPGHRRDSVLPGQAGVSIVFGRQSAYGGYFGAISDLKPGDKITSTTGQGFATYEVTGIRQANDPLPPPLQAGQGRLTLVSAIGTPFMAEDTVRVDAKLVSTSADGTQIDAAPFPSVARLVGPAALLPSEKPMGTDTSALFALVLWAQAFLLAAVFFAWMRAKWGRWQSWAVGVPLMLASGWMVANQLAALLPNLL